LDKYPSITYQAVNKAGKKLQNIKDDDVNAVTWGVFHGREIIQPTVVDAEAFMIWKDEALNIFNNTWAVIYKDSKNDKGEDLAGDEPSCKFLETCVENLFVVNIVENDYVSGDLNAVITEFIEKNQEALKALWRSKWMAKIELHKISTKFIYYFICTFEDKFNTT